MFLYKTWLIFAFLGGFSISERIYKRQYFKTRRKSRANTEYFRMTTFRKNTLKLRYFTMKLKPLTQQKKKKSVCPLILETWVLYQFDMLHMFRKYTNSFVSVKIWTQNSKCIWNIKCSLIYFSLFNMTMVFEILSLPSFCIKFQTYTK